MAIYTRTGDQGMTSLRGDGERVHKNHLQIHVLGGLDEINCHLGVFVSLSRSWLEIYKQNNDLNKVEGLDKIVEEVIGCQSDLLLLGAGVAKLKKERINKDNRKENELNARGIDESEMVKQQGVWIKGAQKFESWIDEMDEELPVLRNFVLPGGSVLGAQLHLTRSIVRRVERELVKLAHTSNVGQESNKLLVEENMQGWLIYINRLSDYLFVLARYVNQLTENVEVIWYSGEKEE